MKLLALLKALQPYEHKEFEKFLKSPYFTESEQYLLFFKQLRKQQPAFELDKSALEHAYWKCFGKDGYTDSKLYNLASNLSHLLENFFIVKQALDSDGTGSRPRREQLVSALSRRNAAAHFQAEAQHLVADIEKKPTKDAGDFDMLQRVYHALYFHPDLNQFQPEAPELQAAWDHLSLYFFMSTFRLLAEIKTRKIIMPDQDKNLMEKVVLKQTADPSLQAKHPLIHIYHRLVKLHDQPSDEAGFKELMKLLLENFDRISSLEQRYLLKHLVNYGIALLRQQCEVNRELLALYKKSIETGSLLVGERLTFAQYINIVKVAASCGELDWAEGFAKKYEGHLEESIRLSVFRYAQAWLLYCKGKLDDAQLELNEMDFPSLLELERRILLVKIIFDRYLLFGKDYDFLMTFLKTNEKYLHRQELAENKREAHVNFIRLVRNIATKRGSRMDFSEQERQKMRKKLRSLKWVINSEWLAERIDML